MNTTVLRLHNWMVGRVREFTLVEGETLTVVLDFPPSPSLFKGIVASYPKWMRHSEINSNGSKVEFSFSRAEIKGNVVTLYA